ncbi:hypothetical protein EVG20_g1368 [Dentipellis fragilis]|uniref:Uncharacterized protein n=1 Tax=Dentipellis fragilis TaxID=205917 RepID=A0A4Y9ZD00_9AGAM|nr:hypothetical protein EVG20_g1368 [Dentipellis fragilis]
MATQEHDGAWHAARFPQACQLTAVYQETLDTEVEDARKDSKSVRQRTPVAVSTKEGTSSSSGLKLQTEPSSEMSGPPSPASGKPAYFKAWTEHARLSQNLGGQASQSPQSEGNAPASGEFGEQLDQDSASNTPDTATFRGRHSIYLLAQHDAGSPNESMLALPYGTSRSNSLESFTSFASGAEQTYDSDQSMLEDGR